MVESNWLWEPQASTSILRGTKSLDCDEEAPEVFSGGNEHVSLVEMVEL